MKKVGLSVVELEPASPGSATAAVISSSSSSFTPGAHTTTGHLVARVGVYDTIEREALAHPKFNFPGKLIGERGIHLKKIEAIACAQLRYFGPWPRQFRDAKDSGKKQHNEQRWVQADGGEDPCVQITSTSEQTLERAKELCVELLRSVKTQWDRYNVRAVGIAGVKRGAVSQPAPAPRNPNASNDSSPGPPGNRRPARPRPRHLHQTRHLHQQPLSATRTPR